MRPRHSSFSSSCALAPGWAWGGTARRLRALILLPALVAVFAGPAHALSRPASSSVAVVIRATEGGLAVAKQSVTGRGGSVGRSLGIINGFAAIVPQDAVAALFSSPGIAAITPNYAVESQSLGYDPTTSIGSLYNVTTMTGAQAYWRAGFTGKGVDVALIDTGVAPVEGLKTDGKVLNGADLSFESQGRDLIYLDTFGHGTHMAGIIAGRDSNAMPGQYAGDTENFIGMAPDSRLVNVKVGDAFGAADVTQVIAAIDWVVEHRKDSGVNIRVLNLSFGTNSRQGYGADPLAYAAEIAWKKGIVVVAAAGNAGYTSSSLMDPAYDPYVLAVGASDSGGTADIADDTVASFSSSGSASRTPDIVAPGTHVESLRNPGSNIDLTFGSARVGDRAFLGSGTSQAAAVASGAAALVLSQRPGAKPDQVKKLLMSTAVSLDGAAVQSQGAGELNLAAALAAPTPSGSQSWRSGQGDGSIESSRGSFHLVMNGSKLTGEKTIHGRKLDSGDLADAESKVEAWNGGEFADGVRWTGNSWSGNSWSGNSWSGNSWSGNSWSGNSWSGNSWSGHSWTGNSWSGGVWTANNFTGGAWTDNVWSDASWS